jgi:hypothetical protein
MRYLEASPLSYPCGRIAWQITIPPLPVRTDPALLRCSFSGAPAKLQGVPVRLAVRHWLLSGWIRLKGLLRVAVATPLRASL